MPQNWNSINDLYFVKSSSEAQTAPAEPEEEPEITDDSPEVRLSEGMFIAGNDGFQFNKKCKVRAKVDYLKTTNRKKVTFKLFVVYNNEEEDLAHFAEGYEENGFAEAEMTLFYGEKYNQALQQDPAAKCSYKFKASHSKGEKEIESELLEMPYEEDTVSRPKFVDVKFQSDKVKCGDKVTLEAQTENISDEKKISFQIKNIDDDKIIATLSGTTKQKKCAAEWISQKQSEKWEDCPEELCVADFSDQLKESSNKLTFYKYPDYKHETKTIACTSGIYAWTGKYHIKFADRALYIGVKIKLINRLGPRPVNPGDSFPAIGTSVSDADKESMKKDIESKLSRKWILHRKNCCRGKDCSCKNKQGCCKFPINIQVFFVENGEDHAVDLFEGSGRANTVEWFRVKTRNNTWAHETGHLLGWYDEYIAGAVGTAPRWKAPNANAIMETGLTAPKEYYQDFKDWITSKTNEPWIWVK